MGLVLGASMISVLEVLGFLYLLAKILCKHVRDYIFKRKCKDTPIVPIK